MKELFVNNSFNFINKHNSLNDYNQIKIKYGLEVMYYFLTKTTIIFLLAYLLGYLKEVIIFNIFYIPLRSTAHGFHAKNNLECWIITIFSYVMLILFIQNIFFEIISLLILISISFISFLLWSPADTENLPLIRSKNRMRLKIISTGILLIESTLSLFLYRNYITISIIMAMININPIIYKLLGLKFNNYIDFQ